METKDISEITLIGLQLKKTTLEILEGFEMLGIGVIPEENKKWQQ